MRTAKNRSRHKFNHQELSRRVKWFTFIGAIFIIMAVFSGCGSSSGSKSDNAAVNSTMADMNTTSSESKMEAPRESQVLSENANLTTQETEADSVQGEGAGTVGQIPTIEDRKLIYNANLVMEVKQYEAAKQRVSDIIHLAGGYALQFNDQFNDYERGGQFIFKVPSKGFQSVLDQLNKVDNVRFERSYSANDVTEEYVDLESRLKARKVNEARLLAFMEKAENTKDLLALSQQLANEQEVIEQITGKMRYIDNNVAMSTIDLRLYETIKTSPANRLNATFGERIGNTLSASLQALKSIVEMVVIIVVALAPFLIVLAVLAIPVVYMIRRNRMKHNQALQNRHAARNAEFLQQQSSESMISEVEADSDPDEKEK